MPFEPLVVILSLVIVLFATFVRSTFGFADALVSMPLLTLTIGIETARPLVAIVSTVFAAVVLLMDWRQVSFGSAWRLTVCAIIGVPIGFRLADMVQEEHVRITLAIVIIAFSVYSLLRPRMFRLTTDRSSYAFGLTAGIFGGVVNIPGPPIAIYGALRGWSPPQFRATFQSYGLPTSLAIVIGHAAKGRFNPDVWWLFLASLPLMAVAIVMGRWLNKKFDGERFRSLIFVLLIVIGTWLLIHSLSASRQNGEETVQLLVDRTDSRMPRGQGIPRLSSL